MRNWLSWVVARLRLEAQVPSDGASGKSTRRIFKRLNWFLRVNSKKTTALLWGNSHVHPSDFRINPDPIASRCRMKFMTKKAISAGAVHGVPVDLRKVLISDPAARAKWEDITPLARNEWICWVISVKKPETRRQHIERVRTELKEGMRRPCCWPGCPHR